MAEERFRVHADRDPMRRVHLLAAEPGEPGQWLAAALDRHEPGRIDAEPRLEDRGCRQGVVKGDRLLPAEPHLGQVRHDTEF